MLVQSALMPTHLSPRDTLSPLSPLYLLATTMIVKCAGCIKPIQLAYLILCVWLGTFSTAGSAAAEKTRQIRLPSTPSVSPDGSRIAFSWIGEIWSAKIDGSDLQRLTNSDATETQPIYSPNGKHLAYVSDRTGTKQIYVANPDGTDGRQVTFHSAGYELSDWFPDNKHLLALGSRDHFHRDSTRMIKINSSERKPEVILADAMAEAAKVSPDGKRVLFTREGERWWRKGFQGERSSQVWMLDLKSGEFQELVHAGVECMWPVWMPDGKGFYFTKGALSGFELWQYRFDKQVSKPGKQQLVYGFEDDSIVFPTISRDGKTIVFRHLFDLYRLNPKDPQPTKLELSVANDVELPADEMKRELTSASDVAFSHDGLEIAFIAGGDVWVMDTILKEPKRVTMTDGYEQDVVFSNDGKELWFVGTTDGQTDIWKATRNDAKQYWWQNDGFEIQQVTNDPHVESDLKFTPDGNTLVMQQGRGDLVRMNPETKKKKRLVKGFSGIDYDISFDSRWIAYSKQDNDFNREIWIARLDGSMKPVNVSRHPDNEGDPKFSADGKILAFTGRRIDREVDIHYVYLQAAEDQKTSRQRKLTEALELMKKKRPAATPKSENKQDAEDEEKKEETKPKEPKSDETTKKETAEKKTLQIDLDDIHKRVRRISIPDSGESNLLFAPTGQKLAFSASIDGKSGWYTVEFPDSLTPKLLTSSTGSRAVWSKGAGGIVYLRSGSPAKVDSSGKLTSYGFRAAQSLSRSGWLKAGFEKAWLTMRENWYDGKFANKNWDEVRRKYAPIAAQTHNTAELSKVIYLMLGELNGSHLGFYPAASGSSNSVEGWTEQTAHLGVRFDTQFKGPGLRVRDVILEGPADREASKLQAGDVILTIDGTAVDPGVDLTTILNGRLDRDIDLTVNRTGDKQGEGEEIEITLRPISYSQARSLLYEQWLEHNRELVDEASKGKLGYLHIRAMNMSSFYEFERQLYNVGYGRQGLVIDVRDNGGGSTTDLLLTSLTQPRHAITQPRGGGQGYPHDRAVFAAWSKPIIVLCNQNSYSNAEIFSHAIKTLGRGKVIGVQTAGGVISTGAATVNDVGRIRVPFRGWFLINNGKDMERNGCNPDETIWPQPGELPQGIDRQLKRAVELLLKDVGKGPKRKKLKYASGQDPK